MVAAGSTTLGVNTGVSAVRNLRSSRPDDMSGEEYERITMETLENVKLGNIIINRQQHPTFVHCISCQTQRVTPQEAGRGRFPCGPRAAVCRLVARHNDNTKTNGLEECRKAIENLGVRPMDLHPQRVRVSHAASPSFFGSWSFF